MNSETKLRHELSERLLSDPYSQAQAPTLPLFYQSQNPIATLAGGAILRAND